MKKLIILFLPFLFFAVNAQNNIIQTDIPGFEKTMNKFIAGSRTIFEAWWNAPADPYLTPQQNTEKKLKAREEAQNKVRIYYNSWVNNVYSVKFNIYKSNFNPATKNFVINNTAPGNAAPYASDMIKFPYEIDKFIGNYFSDSRTGDGYNVDLVQEGIRNEMAKQQDISNPENMILLVQFKLCGNDEFMPKIEIKDAILYRGTVKIPIFVFTRKLLNIGVKPQFDGHTFISGV